jgi:hypothetical protein
VGAYRRARGLPRHRPAHGPPRARALVPQGPHAHGSVYCWAQLDFGEEFVDQAILYQDHYVREDGRWLFERRRHLLWFGQARAENPIAQAADDWPRSHTGRGVLPGALRRDGG